MSDAREEAAVARDALAQGKKKPKQQTTLMTKWDYGNGSGAIVDGGIDGLRFLRQHRGWGAG